MTTFHDFKAADINGAAIDLASYEGSVVLVVNTASKCGFTPQYASLQRVHDSYADQGFAVLGFPCDQFGHQEPGDEAEIAAFCDKEYGVTFPMFAKVEVNGEDAHPLYQWLKSEQSGMFGGAHQVELHQVPDRPRRPGDQPLRVDHQARQDPPRHRGGSRLITAVRFPD